MKQWFYSIVIFILLAFSNSGHSYCNPIRENTAKQFTTNFLISAYIRGNFYNNGRISSSSLNACTDLICIGAMPNADGSLIYDTYELPDGQGVSSLQELISSVKSKITGSTTVRLGIIGGKQWKKMIADETAVNDFVQNVINIVASLNLDGVDLDFEWAQNSEEYNYYSETIIALSQSLDNDKILSVSLDPISYQISSKAIDAVTYVSLQCYGPLPFRFSYENYIVSLQKLIDYGIPANKIVAGLPFYGVTSNDSKQSVAYYSLVNNGLITSPQLNEVNYNGNSFVFNGQDLIQQKVNFALSQGYYGVMCWSLGIDADYNNKWSLLRSINSCVYK